MSGDSFDEASGIGDSVQTLRESSLLIDDEECSWYVLECASERSSSPTADLTDVEIHSTINLNIKSANRVFTVLKVPCGNCQRVGHMSRDCTDPRSVTCFLCGSKGHLGVKCSQAPCQLCFDIGHNSKTCSRKRIKTTVCFRCGLQGHERFFCPEHWRQFHVTINTKNGEISVPERTKYADRVRRFCCNCSGQGHWYFECMHERPSLQSLPFVKTYDGKNSPRSHYSNKSQKRGNQKLSISPYKKNHIIDMNNNQGSTHSLCSSSNFYVVGTPNSRTHTMQWPVPLEPISNQLAGLKLIAKSGQVSSPPLVTPSQSPVPVSPNIINNSPAAYLTTSNQNSEHVRIAIPHFQPPFSSSSPTVNSHSSPNIPLQVVFRPPGNVGFSSETVSTLKSTSSPVQSARGSLDNHSRSAQNGVYVALAALPSHNTAGNPPNWSMPVFYYTT